MLNYIAHQNPKTMQRQNGTKWNQTRRSLTSRQLQLQTIKANLNRTGSYRCELIDYDGNVFATSEVELDVYGM